MVLRTILETIFDPYSVSVRSWGSGSRWHSEVIDFEVKEDIKELLGDNLDNRLWWIT